MENTESEDPRYPYTYAADLLRSIPQWKPSFTLSRSDASKIRQMFSKVLGIPDEELVKKLADYYLEHAEQIATTRAAAIIAEISNPNKE